MESIRVAYKNDDFGNPIYARVSWTQTSSSSPRPIAILYHGGGLIVGSSEIIPKSQTEHLANAGFVVVAPNYRLSPQVTASTAIADSLDAHDWTTATLPNFLQTHHSITLAPKKVVAAGHSTGGTLALLLGTCRPLTAVTAFYPSLYVSDETSSAHQACAEPPFSHMPDFAPTQGDWESITPRGTQISEAGLAVPGTLPSPRNRWQATLLKTGRWMRTICPDGDYRAVDAMAGLSTQVAAGERWPAVCLVQGDEDRLPGSGIDLARRAEREMRDAGVREVSLVVVSGAGHMFDMPLNSSSPAGSG